jgi:hypothetical protein
MIFTRHKILQRGADGFTSFPKEGMLQIFMTFTNPLPWLDLNPRTLGPVATISVILCSFTKLCT